jgi:hypothetical protein
MVGILSFGHRYYDSMHASSYQIFLMLFTPWRIPALFLQLSDRSLMFSPLESLYYNFLIQNNRIVKYEAAQILSEGS